MVGSPTMRGGYTPSFCRRAPSQSPLSVLDDNKHAIQRATSAATIEIVTVRRPLGGADDRSLRCDARSLNAPRRGNERHQRNTRDVTRNPAPPAVIGGKQ